MDAIRPLREFVLGMTRLVDETASVDPAQAEITLLRDARGLLSALINTDTWLPDEFAQSDPNIYKQYLLYCDPLERFSVASFVWAPGQQTPIHNHTVWGLVGVLRGRELCTEYLSPPVRPAGHEHWVEVGMIDAVSPTIGDWHVVANAVPDCATVSIHVYGANIGAVARNMIDPVSGEIKDFVTGYANTLVPNLWDRSASVRAALQTSK
jgi:3-mercaptopropionate dioxygenase